MRVTTNRAKESMVFITLNALICDIKDTRVLNVQENEIF
jgi:hypothetical protein